MIDDELILDDKLMPVDELLLNDDELNKIIKTLCLLNMIEMKEFLTIFEENIIYEIPDDISEFADMFKDDSTNHSDEIDNSIEIKIICINKVL